MEKWKNEKWIMKSENFKKRMKNGQKTKKTN
jgi:hypothetical protein